MDILGKMLGLEEVGNLRRRVVIDEDGADQILLGFHIMWRGAIAVPGRLSAVVAAIIQCERFHGQMLAQFNREGRPTSRKTNPQPVDCGDKKNGAVIGRRFSSSVRRGLRVVFFLFRLCVQL